MHPKTKMDLALIQNKLNKINVLKKDIKYIEELCEHNDLELCCIENFSYDVAPAKRCIVCRKITGDLTFEEKVEALKKALFDEGEYEDVLSNVKEIDELTKAGG